MATLEQLEIQDFDIEESTKRALWYETRLLHTKLTRATTYEVRADLYRQFMAAYTAFVDKYPDPFGPMSRAETLDAQDSLISKKIDPQKFPLPYSVDETLEKTIADLNAYIQNVDEAIDAGVKELASAKEDGFTLTPEKLDAYNLKLEKLKQLRVSAHEKLKDACAERKSWLDKKNDNESLDSTI